MGERKDARRVLVGITKEKKLFGRPRRRGRIILIRILTVWENVDRMNVAQDKNKWRAVVNTVMNLWVPWNAGNLIQYSQAGLCSME
jgi:hypothetical protein